MKLSRTAAALAGLILPLVGGLTAAAEAAPAAPTGSLSASVSSAATALSGTTYYVASAGSDSASGQSASSAWRTLDRASRAALQPGDQLLLEGGATFTGANGLVVTASGTATQRIRIGSYGTGAATVSGSKQDCVQLRGSNLTVRGIAVAKCTWAGVHVFGDHDRVRYVEASGSWAGVQVEASSSYTEVLDSSIHDNTRMTPNTNGPDDDSGAFGVLANGDHIDILRNDIRRQDAPSKDYGRDGSAVEVFGGRHVRIADNRGAGNQTFTEIGGLNDKVRAMELQVEDNRVTSKDRRTFFVVVHAGDAFGAAHDVQVNGNSATLTGADSVGVVCGPVCTSDALTVGTNTINAAGGAMYVGGSYRQG